MAQNNGGEFIIKIDRTDGSFVKVGEAIEGITYIYPDDRTFDEDSRIFYLIGATEARLYGINVTDGSIASRPLCGLSCFHFDRTMNRLFGIEQDNYNNLRRLVSINRETGAYESFGDLIPGSAMYSGGFSAYNSNEHILYMYSPTSVLYSINTMTGKIMNAPVLSIDTEFLVHFAYHHSRNTLYGLLKSGDPDKFFLVKIDPENRSMHKNRRRH